MSATMKLLKQKQQEATTEKNVEKTGTEGSAPAADAAPANTEAQTDIETAVAATEGEPAATEAPEVPVPTKEEITNLKTPGVQALYEKFGLSIEGWDGLSVPKKKKALVAALHGGEVSTEVAKPKQEILPGDVIHSTANAIENVTDASEAETMVRTLLEDTEFNAFKIGGYLAVIQAKQWFGNYANFKDYVEGVFGLHYRKANYWVNIYTGLLEANVSWEQVKGLGWTKLKELVGILTPENVVEWVEKASGMTTIQLIEHLKAEKKGGGKATEGGESLPVTTMTFKVHSDQKEVIEQAITKAKQASGTESQTAALEGIALEYLGKAPAAPAKTGGEMPSMLEVFQHQKEKHGSNKDALLAEIFEAFEKVFPDINLTIDAGS
jgi:hypothetical protein